MLFKKEHRGQSLIDLALGADDFLPIFIYVLVKSQLFDIVIINEEIQRLCDPDSRLSEVGYYLATLEASIQHILDIDVNSGELQHCNSDHSSIADDRFQRIDSFSNYEGATKLPNTDEDKSDSGAEDA